MHYLTYLLLDCLHLITLNYGLYAEGSEWDELEKHALQIDALPPIFCFLPNSVATVVGIIGPRPAPPGVVELDEDSVPVPALQSSELLMTLAFPNRPVVYSELSWANIGMVSARKRLQKLHTGSEREKMRMHLSEGKSHGPSTPTHQSKTKIKEEVIDTTEPANSVRLPEDAMNALGTLREVMYPVCSLHNVEFCLVVECQVFERN